MMTSLKIGAVVLLMAGCFVAGWYSNRTPPVIQTKIQTVEKVVTKIVKVTKPDGTTEETTETTSEESNDIKNPDPKPMVATVPRTDYSLGVQFDPSTWLQEKYAPVGIDFGYRVLGNAWMTAGYNWQTKAATLGFRIDF